MKQEGKPILVNVTELAHVVVTRAGAPLRTVLLRIPCLGHRRVDACLMTSVPTVQDFPRLLAFSVL